MLKPSAFRRLSPFHIHQFYRRTYAVKPSKQPTVSSCPQNTVIEGVNYLKGQQPVLALADEEYPPWLWTLLQPKVLPDDGPGGLAEKARMRRERRLRIKDENFMKTQ